MPKVLSFVIFTALAVMMEFGCTERPSDRIETAERLVTEAKQGEAAVYATEDVQRLQRLLVTLQATVETQDDYPRFMRDYGQADTLAERIAQDAQQVIEQSSTERIQARAEASAALEQAQAVLALTRREIHEARERFGSGHIRRQAVDSDALLVSLERATEAFDTHDYLAATARARAVTAQAQSITDQVEALSMRIGDVPERRLHPSLSP
ncbi:hypothetical protein YTPLAS18_02440 [Nitrospira sp.]|nr:hypothetical protein YTPLAS18_02440 [Nitrospira sp.]